MRAAIGYYHWFFLIQPAPLPERMIGGDPAFYLRWTLGGWGSNGLGYIEPEALAEYERCFCRADTIHATCEDYRAGASIDLEHDRASRAAGEKIACDLLLLWGTRGLVGRRFDPLALWRARASGAVEGSAMEAGHFIPEELPDDTARRLRDFFLAAARRAFTLSTSARVTGPAYHRATPEEERHVRVDQQARPLLSDPLRRLGALHRRLPRQHGRLDADGLRALARRSSSACWC